MSMHRHKACVQPLHRAFQLLGVLLAGRQSLFITAYGNLALDMPEEVTSSCSVACIAGGSRHAIAMLKDGSLIGWDGSSTAAHALSVPEGRKAVQIATGNHASFAALDNGSMMQWGSMDPTVAASQLWRAVPVPLKHACVKSIAAGQDHVIVLLRDGSVTGYGFNRYNQLTFPRDLLAAGSIVQQIAAGSYHSLALKSDGHVVAFGFNGFGQVTLPNAVRAGEVRKIGAGNCTSYALLSRNGGQLAVWGWDYCHRLRAAELQTDVTDFAAGYGHVAVLQATGVVRVYSFDSENCMVSFSLKPKRTYNCWELQVQLLLVIGYLKRLKSTELVRSYV
jgi:alpha-tubulin suppressor-like RCC1 family protein